LPQCPDLKEKVHEMISKEVLRLQAAHYRRMAEQLRADCAGIDDETLKDTLEGVSDLPAMIEELIRSSLADGALMTGLKARLEEMDVRLQRLKERHEKKRERAAWAMAAAQMRRLEVEDFSVSLAQGSQKLAILDETKLPAIFFVPQPSKLDRSSLFNTLKRGEAVEGASLILGSPHVAVRTR
jgi:hypothetical protein